LPGEAGVSLASLSGMTSPARLNPNYGKGEAFLDIDGGGVDPFELSSRISALFSRPNFKPPMLPAMALEVMKASRKPRSNIDELVEVVSRDPMIAADVLKLSRSALYAAATPVRTLKEAALRIGVSGVQSVVLETLQRVIFRSVSMAPALDAVRRHGAAAAHLARLVARQTSVDAEFAFLCGLLHDVGLSAGLMALGSDPHARLDDEQWASLEQVHEKGAELLARYWQLPAEVALVLSKHHASDGELERQHPAVSILVIAEHLAEQHGLDVMGRLAPLGRVRAPESVERSRPERVGAARRMLRLNDAQFAQLYAGAAKVSELLCQQP
jgi:HD-like signal output (HDOD) protein